MRLTRREADMITEIGKGFFIAQGVGNYTLPVHFMPFRDYVLDRLPESIFIKITDSAIKSYFYRCRTAMFERWAEDERAARRSSASNLPVIVEQPIPPVKKSEDDEFETIFRWDGVDTAEKINHLLDGLQMIIGSHKKGQIMLKVTVKRSL